MSIGLLVDFNMHILLRYYESPFHTRDEKVKDALQTMGSSVLIGGFSTFLGVLPLFFSSSEVMMTLFYSFVGMVILGCSVGLSVLPILLSIFGPLDTVGTRRKTSLTLNLVIPGSFSSPPSKRKFKWDLEASVHPNSAYLSRGVEGCLSEKRMEAILIALYSEHDHSGDKTTLMLPVTMDYDSRRLPESEESFLTDRKEKSSPGETSFLRCRATTNIKEGQMRHGKGECKAIIFVSDRVVKSVDAPYLHEPSLPAVGQSETTKEEDQLRPDNSPECKTMDASCSSVAALESRDNKDVVGPEDVQISQPAVNAMDENTDGEDDDGSVGSAAVPTTTHLTDVNPKDKNLFEENSGTTSALDPKDGQTLQSFTPPEDEGSSLEGDSSVLITESVLVMAQSVDEILVEESPGEASSNCQSPKKEQDSDHEGVHESAVRGKEILESEIAESHPINHQTSEETEGGTS